MPHTHCRMGSCQRHKDCMYMPCRAFRPPWEDPDVMAEHVVNQRELDNAKKRVRQVGLGRSINGAYKLPPEEALDAFRKDLLRIVGE